MPTCWRISPNSPRRFLKYALQRGMLAGLDAKDFALVREAHAAARSIEEPARSPEHLEGRKSKDPFDDPTTARKLEEVVSGKADREQENLRRGSAKARQTGTPNLMISDEELGKRAGSEVKARLFHDRERGVVWFFDQLLRFRYFDGFDLADPPFQLVNLDAPSKFQAFLQGVTRVSEQATWWGKTGRDAVRYGDRVLLWGKHEGLYFRIGFLCAGEKEAKDLFERLRACPPEGYVECKPWYVPGRGAVARQHEKFAYRFVHHGRLHWRGPAFKSNEEAFAAYQNLQLQALRDGGAQLLEIELQADTLEPEDQTVAEWLRDRVRDDDEDVLWHLRALTELRDYVERHGLGPATPGFSIDVGQGAPDADLRAFEKVCEQKLPDELRAVWKEFGHAEWRVGGRRMRFLSPKDVLARRDALRAGKAGLDAVGLKNVGAQLKSIDALVVDERERARIVLLDVPEPEGRVFAEVADYPARLNPSNLLRWLVAVDFLTMLHDELVRAAPVLKRLPYGQAFNPKESVRRFECTEKGSSKFWEVSLDEKRGAVSVRYGRIGADGSVDTKRHADGAAAKKAVDKLIAEKLKKGYKEIPAKA
jgi:predicted DNA-binding WGR domain protein